MGEKLTIIVTCTDRKSLPVTEDLRLRNLGPGTIEERAEVWREKVRRAAVRRPLRELYQGETWAQVPRLVRAARDAGYDPSVLVASAGLGLKGLNHRAPAYGATFSRGHDDSVGTTVEDARAWWRALQQGTSETFVGATLWVMSKGYSKVLAEDLLAKTSDDRLLVFGGSDEVPRAHRVASNRGLRHALGGTANSLNLRMAVRWLELSKAGEAFSAASHTRWQEWTVTAERSETLHRDRMTDDAVLDFIRSLRRTDLGLTKTRALRRLRDAGLACEQGRFGTLFVQTGANA